MATVCSVIIAIFATVLFIGLLRLFALRLGFVDRPGGRKRHHHEVPLIGGIAIFLGFCLGLISLPFHLNHAYALIVGGGIVVGLGVIDDFRDLNSKVRLTGELVAALILIFWGQVQVSYLGNLLFLGNIHLGLWGIPFTIVLVAGFMNAMNMIDGQDGLAGGVALGQVILLIYLNWHVQNQPDLTMLTILGLLLLVFLIFNMRTPWRIHAAIFLGDAGSTFIAFAVAWFAIRIGQSGGSIKPAIILWILAFPVFDLLHVCIIRFTQGKSLLKPSLDHFHHLLQAVRVDPASSTWLLTVLSLALGIVGVLLNHFQVAEGWQFVAWLGALVIYLGITKLIRNSMEYQHAACE